MSWDFVVRETNLDDFAIASLEEFCKTEGYTVSIHPNTNLIEDSGFLPFKTTGDFLSGLDSKDLLSGFEFYSELADPATEQQSIKPQSKGLLKGLFRKNQPPVDSTTPVSATPNEEKYNLTLVCGGDLLEIFIAHLFSLYFSKLQGCECYDPQDDIKYQTSDELEKALNDIVVELKIQLSKGTLRIHYFESWS